MRQFGYHFDTVSIPCGNKKKEKETKTQTETEDRKKEKKREKTEDKRKRPTLFESEISGFEVHQ